jgi:hypothetical protein
MYMKAGSLKHLLIHVEIVAAFIDRPQGVGDSETTSEHPRLIVDDHQTQVGRIRGLLADAYIEQSCLVSRRLFGDEEAVERG